MTQLAPADELALIRADLSRLKLREQELRKRLLDGPETQRQGAWAQADVVDRVVRVFDHRLLPQELRDDPLYWRDRTLTELQCTVRGPLPFASWQDAVLADDAGPQARSVPSNQLQAGPRPPSPAAALRA